MKLTMSANRKLLALATSGVLAAGAVVATSGSSFAAAKAAGNSSELVMESSPETTITQNFNPFAVTQAPYGMGATGLIYEPLIEFDIAAPPKYYPWLATGFKWSNGGRAITFTIRNGVTWSDGKPFSAADVAFTFNMLKKNTDVNLSGLQIKGVAQHGNKVTVSFATPQYANLQNIAGTGIVPEHIWSSVGDPGKFTDPNPVGTGPYTLSNFTPEGFTLAARSDYWQKSMMPHVQKVYFPVYTSNTGALDALFSGQIDWTGNFIPGLQKDFVNKAPATRGYWEAPTSSNAFDVNLHKWPTNQLPVRQAISAALNRTLLAKEGEAGLENPVLNASGITLPTYKAWAGPVKNLTNSPTAQAAKARAILKKAGYTMKGGFFYKGNQEVTVTFVSPSAYTDYAEVGSIAAQELRAAGINASFQGLSVNAWNSDVADGNFSISEHWSNSGLTPYNLYDNWLDSRLVNGNNASGDYERLSDPAINKDLDKLAGAATVAQQTAALAPIARYVAQNLPIIPITTASAWFEYNSQHFVGWPSQKNPYEVGQPSGSNDGPGAGTDLVVVLHLRPRA